MNRTPCIRSSSPPAETLPSDAFVVRVLRQDGPGRRSYWQRFRVDYEPDMNCISVLQKIAERPVTVEGQRVAPVVWECNCLEEVCGACTMLVNGRVRQACTALVDQLLGGEKGTEARSSLRPDDQVPGGARSDGRSLADLCHAGEGPGVAAGR